MDKTDHLNNTAYLDTTDGLNLMEIFGTGEQGVEDLIRHAADRLQAGGIDSPEHDAMVLLAFASSDGAEVSVNDIRTSRIMGVSLRSALARWHQLNPVVSARCSERCLIRFSALIERRMRHEPLQYIVGHVHFRFLDVLVGEGVFIPRQETELVVEAALEVLRERRSQRHRVVDLCTGSGAIALSLATEMPKSDIHAVERSKRAIAWTRRNIKAYRNRIDEVGSTFELIEGDAVDASTLQELDGQCDLVVSNPPYVPEREIPEQSEVRDWEPELALYGDSPDGLAFPKRIIERVATLLKDGGTLVMEHDISQGKALREFALDRGYQGARTGQDLTHRDRFLVATR